MLKRSRLYPKQTTETADREFHQDRGEVFIDAFHHPEVSNAGAAKTTASASGANHRKDKRGNYHLFITETALIPVLNLPPRIP